MLDRNAWWAELWPAGRMLDTPVLLCNAGTTWRMTMKELMHMITEQCADGEKTSLDVL